MFDYLNIFLVASICGFIASIPVGPVNLQLANHCFQSSRKHLSYFIFGVILIDVSYVALAFWSYFFIDSPFHLDFGRTESIISGVLIMALGLYFLWKNQARLHQNNSQQFYNHTWHYFLEGALLCASNLMLFMLWFFVAGIFEEYRLIINRPSTLFVLLMGIAFGDFIWFYALAWWLRRKRQQMSHTQTYRLQKLLAISLVLFGLFTACR